MKRIIAALLAAIMMIMPMCVETFAEETNYDDLVMPCYDYIQTLRSTITEGSLGFVTIYSSTYCESSDKTVVLNSHLQQSANGSSGWSNYKSYSTTKTGTGTSEIEKTIYAPAGYYYRTYTHVQVKNSSNVIVEVETLYSVNTIER